MIRPTRYEIAALSPSGERFLAGYVRVPSKIAMTKMVRQHGDAWIMLTGTDRIYVSGTGWRDWRLTLGSWTIQYSGRTKHEAEMAPLPWFKNELKGDVR